MVMEASESIYRFIVENANEIIGIVQDDEIKYANPRAEKITGYSVDELTSGSFLQFVHPDDREMVNEHHTKRLEGEEEPYGYIFRIVDKYGNIKWLDNSNTMIEWNGKPAILALLIDITERKQTEDKLRESEGRYSSLVANLPDVVWTTSSEGQTVFISQNAKAAYGFTPEEIYQAGADLWFGRIHPDDVERVKEAYASLFVDNASFDIEYRIQRKNGRWIWLHDRSASIYEREGITYADGIFSDVTEHKQMDARLKEYNEHLEEMVNERIAELKQLNEQLQQEINRRRQAEKELRERELRYRNVIALTGGFAYEHSSGLENPYLFIDKGIERLVGHKVDELTPKIFQDLTEEDIRYPVETISVGSDIGLRENEKKVTTFRSDFSICTPDGQTAWLSDYSIDIRDSDGHVTRSMGMLQDITERKGAEETLRESEEKFHKIYDTAFDGMLVMEGYKFIDCNENIVRDFGLRDKNDIIGLHPWDISPKQQPDGGSSKEKAIELIDRVYAGNPQRFYWKHLGPNGTFYDMDISLNRFDVKGKEYLMVAQRDITERKKAEESLRESEERYRGIVEHANEIFYIIGPDTEIIFITPQVKEVLGYSPEEVINKKWIDFLTGNPINQKGLEIVEELFEIGAKAERIEFEYYHKSGEIVLLETYGSPVLDDNGKVIASTGAARDITERKQVEEALKESEEKYRTVVENANEAIIVAQDDIVKYANPEAVRLISYPKDELISRPFLEFIHPDDRGMVYEGYVRNLRGKGIGAIDFRLVNKDGSIRWAYPDSTAIIWEDRPATLNFLTDITRRKKVEEELQLERDTAQKYLDIAGVVIVALNADQTVTMINKKGCDILGYKENEIIKQNWFDNFIPEAIRKQTKAYFVRLIAGEIKPIEYYENPILAANNEERIISWHNSLLTDTEGNIIGTLSSGMDITERKRAEDQIQELNQIIVQMKDAVIMSKNNMIEYVNDAFCNIYGYERDEVIGQPTRMLFAGSQEEFKALGKKFNAAFSGGTSTIEYQDRRKDGSVFWVSNTAGTVYIERTHELHWLNVIRDITEQKQAEEELHRIEEASRQLQQELTHVSRVSAMGELLASIAHEINQPLAATLNNAQAAQRFLALDAPDLDEVGDILIDIAEDSRRASAIIQRLRSLLQKGETHWDNLYISEIIYEIATLMKAEFTSRNIFVKLDLLPKLPPILGDRIQLQQVLMNLILNACDAMMGITPSLRELIIETSADKSENIVVAVRDSGSGLDDEEMGHMFEAFYTTKADGIGMGLSICRSIIEAHGGNLWAENNPDQGATLHFTVPLHTGGDA